MTAKYTRDEHLETYLHTHGKRFDYLLDTLKKFAPDKSAKILDIGRSPFTNLLFREYKNVTTLGLDTDITLLDKADLLPFDDVPHLVFDLNNSKSEKDWIKLPLFDVIIFAEVMEHLSIAPEFVLAFLKSGLKNNGIIICQTPNATAVGKRIKMLLGINPYDRFPLEGETGSSHIREYTKKELIDLPRDMNLKVVRHDYANYLKTNKKSNSILWYFSQWIPGLRTGQTIVYQKYGDRKV